MRNYRVNEWNTKGRPARDRYNKAVQKRQQAADQATFDALDKNFKITSG
jgi:P2-related tail formation protein